MATNGKTRYRTSTPDIPRWTTAEAILEFEDRETMCYIDDREITIPVKVSTSVALAYVDIARSKGADAAIEYAGIELLGEADFRFVRSWPGLGPQHWTRVVKALDDKLLGALRDPKSSK